MKLTGFVGTGTGKLGASVFSVRKGQQVVRQYQPNVTNPNTRPQVVQRAKFKLLTQLAAAIGNNGFFYANVRAGSSQRNEFMRRNMDAVNVIGSESVATLSLPDVVLTSGGFMFNTPEYNRTTGVVNIDLTADELENVVGATVVTISSPEIGRIIGGAVRVVREESAGNIEVPVLVPPTLVRYTNALVWLWRFRDGAARAKYENATQGAADTEVALTFERMVSAGDIEVSVTLLAAFATD